MAKFILSPQNPDRYTLQYRRYRRRAARSAARARTDGQRSARCL